MAFIVRVPLAPGLPRAPSGDNPTPTPFACRVRLCDGSRPVPKPARFPPRAVADLFLTRQQLDRPRGRRLTAASLAALAEATGGIQLDSINVVARAHLLTLWSRFGVFDQRA